MTSRIPALALLFACTQDPAPAEDPTSTAPVTSEPTTTPRRVVAFGDVHGDVDAARGALTLAGLIDASDAWIGGDTLAVQVGDQLDRGDDEQEILDLFENLRLQATKAGGAFHPLLGNHEIMNVELDLRYVTDGGFADFSHIEYDENDPELATYPEEQRGRVAAFRPGGPYALLLAEHSVILELEGTLFVHGGVLPEHVEYGIDAINQETSAWMRGESSEPAVLTVGDSPVWSRHYSDSPGTGDCELLDTVLTMSGASRMVVAHTVQDSINPECDDQVWRVDVGMAAYYGGSPEVLEIIDEQVTVLTP